MIVNILPKKKIKKIIKEEFEIRERKFWKALYQQDLEIIKLKEQIKALEVAVRNG